MEPESHLIPRSDELGVRGLFLEGSLRNEIAACAYLLWAGRGFPVGTDFRDWLEAEARVRLDDMARQLGEQIRRKDDALLRALLDNATDVIYVKDVHGRYLLVNRQYERLFGPCRDAALGRTDYDLFPQAMADAFRTNDLQVLAAGVPREFEEQAAHADGIHTYVSVKFPILDDAGRPYAVAGISRDISERKRAERHLAAEHAVTRVLADSASLDEAAPGILRSVGEALGWEVGTFWGLDSGADVMRCVAVWHRPEFPVPEFEGQTRRIGFPRDLGLPGRVWASGEPVWIENVAVDPNFPRWAAALREGLHGGFAVPVHDGPRLLGVIEFFSRDIREPDEPLLDMMRSIAGQICQFIERRRAERTIYQRQREFQLARDIQKSRWPRGPADYPGFEIQGRSRPASETNGDYYDFFRMPDERLAAAIGDASGHGVGAALLMAEIRSCLRALALSHADAGHILTLTNRSLTEDPDGGHFVSLLLVCLDPGGRSLVYAGAGHWPAYVFDAQGALKAQLESGGFPLGVDGRQTYPTSPQVRLEPGDLVLLLTDGLLEVFGAEGDLFGIGRALEVVRTHHHRPAAEILDSLFESVRDFARGPQADDQTAVVIKVTG